ncbi:hypothetical protein HYH03_013200 [Edaphochlamys debaryana]|uniref:EGF-like domain-containing protein n=1 Tax=Edaphochlamys debaryana TaxID=47281 RepID=A0A835XQG1_9CHLO|nr:hypothetical protein HYH03_013200 [Edaphochlamys debaryana]|eukprot:KAG2488206.1 hypothetical protein HYH03_013200 [Edaphochlamys debaryana]
MRTCSCIGNARLKLQSSPEGAGAWDRPPASDLAFLDAYYFLRGLTSSAQMPPAPGWTPERDRCPKGCTDHGTCHQEEGRCDCPRGRTGPDCSQPLATSCKDWCRHELNCHSITRELCVNECNQRGACVSGFCHCFPGYYGADCSISMDWDASPAPRPVLLQGLGYEINPRGPKIFVYEFPPQYNVWGKFEYILKHYGRYWERRRAGRDHLITAVGDKGRCEATWTSESLRPFNGTPGNASAPPLDLAPLLARDIVIPPLVGDYFGPFSEWGIWHPKRQTHPINKTILASMAGSLCGAGKAEEPPCQVVKRAPDIIQLMARSVFCFVPTGGGYGKRNVMAVSLGCIPVVISDHVAQPWEPFLDWNSFGVWIPEADMNATEAILKAFTPEEKAEKMRKLHCAAMHLTWSSVFGSVIAGDSGAWDAVATLVWILRARARNPGVPDHRLREVDPDFDAFMDCRTLVPGTAATQAAGGSAGAAAGSSRAPPLPPMPTSAHAALLLPSAAATEAADFPHRTFSTAAWAAARAAAGGGAAGPGGRGALDIALPGLGSNPRAGAMEAAPGEGAGWVVMPGGLNLT